ncbi:maleylpyruvate isomerase family mycothiol-dependent enzyme [Dactylosporangium sp. NPDC050688]|uniref:maleylpyruvate isomerase family mycothiol-dependent enzyme n=1 Tax=Dactylosporangium sp. NPDC050688 TaxID=3157217 RepID=UPI0033E8996C
MNRLELDHVWAAVDAQRTALCDLLDDLTDDEWRHPSLCEGWTVRDVAAHLTMQQLGPLAALGVVLHWRGSMDRTVAHVSRRRAAQPTDRLVAQICGMVGSRRHTVGVTPLEALADALIHSQDIAVPLGRRLDLPTAAAATAATRLLTMRMPPPLPSVRKVAGLRLTATDTSWSTGTGPEVRGPMGALLMVIAGRRATLPELTGPGAAALAARLQRPAPV